VSEWRRVLLTRLNGRRARRLQWRDRAGLRPASLL